VSRKIQLAKWRAFIMSDLSTQIKTRRQSAEDYLVNKRMLWDKVEQLFHNQLNDSASSKTKSQVFDPKLGSLLLERSYRVMAQLQTGKVIGISKNDIGDAKLKNLVLDRYVIPNANAQFDFLTKMRMMDLYSGIYGNMFSLTDWDVKPNGYMGPDVWLLNIRDVFPQVGAVSLEDSDYVIVRSWRPLSYFENLKKQDGFKNVDKIIGKLKDTAGSKQNRGSKDKGQREAEEYPSEAPVTGKGYYEVLSMFERDRWSDLCVDADMEFRDSKNPQDNGELPVDCKYSIPLLDDFMGMGDAERGASMQMARNSGWNLYFDAVKMSIYPPVLINKDNIASMSSIRRVAGANWLVRNQLNNSAMPINLTPQGISTFNTIDQVTNASILNLFGTTDTAVNANTDPGFGKTPQALQMQAARENTRDNADRFYMEQYLTKIMKKMVNLLSKKQSSAITLRMFEPEVKKMAKDYPEIMDAYDEKTGKLSIKKGTGSLLYDYEIVSGSTYATDQAAQQKNLQMFLQLYMNSQTPQGNTLANDLKTSGYTLNFGELFKRIISSSGIQDWDKILEEQSEQEKDQNTLQTDAQKFQQVIQQIQGNINQVPPQPGQTPAGLPQSPPQGVSAQSMMAGQTAQLGQ
jgi:hypothetical protein